MKLYTSIVRGSNAVVDTIVNTSETMSEIMGERGIRPVIRHGLSIARVNMEFEVKASEINNSHRLELTKMENNIEYRREKHRLTVELEKLKEAA